MIAGNLESSRKFLLLALLAVFFSYGECTISAWSKPVIATPDGGNGALAETIDDGKTTSQATGITITATTDDTISAYTKVSQSPSDVVFAIDNSGVVTVTSGTISYSTTSVYTLVISATDTQGTVTATVTLSVNDKPAFGSTNYRKLIDDKAAVGTTLATIAASDSVNGGSLTYSIASGNTNTDFSVSSSGMIKTLNAMAAATTGGYQLVIEAADASLTGTTTVWVLVESCSGATSLLVGTLSMLMALIVFVLQ